MSSTITSKKYCDLSSEEKQIFFAYLRHIITSDNTHAAKNMWDDDWKNNKSTLPYILELTDRFHNDNGDFFIMYNEKDIVSCGGVYKSNFNREISIAAVRTYTDKKYRNFSILRETLLPLCKQWSIDHGTKLILLTFNEYNKSLIQVFKRRRLGETQDRMSTRKPHHLFYNGISEIPFPIIVQYTKQWAIYEQLDPTFVFDWETIKA